MLLEARIEFLVRSQGGRRLVHDHEINAVKLGLVMSERLSDDSLDPISRRRLPAVFLGDREPQAGLRIVRAPGQYRKAFITAAPRFFEDTIVPSPIDEPLVFTEGVTAGRYQRATIRATGAVADLRRQASTALGAAPFDDLAAGLGGHAGTEAVGARAL